MQLPVQQFPILAPGQMNPYHQALQSGLENYTNTVQAAYLPQKLQADIASKSAYAAYSPYSYLAKALSDPITMAVLAKNPEQLKNVMDRLSTIPTNPMTAMDDMFNKKSAKPGLWDNLKEALGFNGSQSQPAPAIEIAQQNNPIQQNPVSADAAPGFSVDDMPEGMTPNQEAAWKQGAPGSLPVNTQVPNQNPQANASSDLPMSMDEIVKQSMIKAFPNSPAAIESERNKEFQKTRGNENAKKLTKMGDVISSGQIKQQTYDMLGETLNSADFQEMRKVPLAGHYELDYFGKFGTPKQQQLVGQFKTLAGNIIKDSSRDFAGQFRVGEQKLLENMKPVDSDTVDTMIGKVNALSNLNKFITGRTQLTAQYMLAGKDQITAQEMADKQLQGDKIRSIASTIQSKTAGKTPWPVDKDAINESEVEGKESPPDTVWMIRPDGKKVPVHNSQVERAMNDPSLRFRKVE